MKRLASTLGDALFLALIFALTFAVLALPESHSTVRPAETDRGWPPIYSNP